MPILQATRNQQSTQQPQELVAGRKNNKLILIAILMFCAIVLIRCGIYLGYRFVQLPISSGKTQTASLSQTTPSIPVSLTNYPATTYPVISATQLQEKKQEFLSRNGAQWQVFFDRYGFVESTELYDSPYTVATNPNCTFTDCDDFSNAEIQYIQSFIQKNMDFFGIDSMSTFKLNHEYNCFIDSSSNKKVCGNGILTANQLINNNHFFNRQDYINSSIVPLTIGTDFVSPIEITTEGLQGFSITGHFWPKLIIPQTPLISKATILNTAKTNNYVCASTVCSNSKQLNTNSLIVGIFPDVFAPDENNPAEGRLTYMLYNKNLKAGSQNYSEGTGMGYYIFDAITGKPLPTNQLYAPLNAN